MFVSSKVRTYSVATFFGLLLCLGLWILTDYGVSWDEPTDHQNGAVSGRYVAELLFPELLRGNQTLATIPPIANYSENDHGVLFELPVAGLGLLLTPGNSQGYYYMRHLLIFLTFVGAVWALYRIGCLYFQSWQLGLLSAFLLVLSPRIFAEAFFNGKDIPFMACFALSIYTLSKLLMRPSWQHVLLHALATAAAIAMRVPGIVLVVFTAGMVGLEMLWPTSTYRLSRARWLLFGTMYLSLTALLTVAAWPALWADPITNFLKAYQSLSHFDWPAKTNYYLGEYVPVKQLPWHYIPVWLSVTTPLLYLIAALLGLAKAAWDTRHGGWARLQTLEGRLDLLMAGWLVGPVLVVVALHSSLYDGWRHLYFIYPALLLWAVRGIMFLISLFQNRQQFWRVAAVCLGLAALELFRIAGQMISLHPYEHMYFSLLSPKAAERLLERDYWGLAFREGIEWILAHDASPQITINSSSQYPLYNNSLLLDPKERGRLKYMLSRKARYFITNFRWQPQSYLDSVGIEVYFVRAGGVKVLSVFRRP